MKRGDLIELDITDFAFGGKGIARLTFEDGRRMTVFVGNTFPGQKVLAKIVKKKSKYAECNLVKVLVPSPDEVSIPYQPISGSPYISLPIEKQKEYKFKSTIELFRRIGEVRNVDDLFDAYIESPEIWNYRNKMEYSFSSIEHDMETGEDIDDAFALGFKHRGTWWKVENLNKESGLFDADFENKLIQIREYLKATGFPAWHPPKKVGFFRYIVVRKSFHEDKLLINLVTSSENIHDFNTQAFGEFVKGLLGDRIAGIQLTVNDDVADRAKIENGYTELIFGEPLVIEQILGLNFEISMESFFQTNPKCAEKLYSKAIDYAFESNELDGQVIMDLFCGTGTIGQVVASKTKNAKIIGVDIVPEAIDDAKKNAERNGISGIDFFAADVGKFLFEYPEYEGKIGTIILDPPRAGIAPKTLRKVMRLNAKRIVYISCNPATQARDTKDLQENGYQLKKFSLVDQFPHTGHIESVALFDRI
ncbi:MAG: 23S rRNA (uracil(1939)-C(5))-methyltransferase RlmD [Crocinitomicaceae bacterium]